MNGVSRLSSFPFQFSPFKFQMLSIELNGMKFHAPIGVYDYERRDGNDIVVDVRLTLDEPAAYDDDITGTVNYADVYELVKAEVCRPIQLLETVANRIRQSILNGFPAVQSITVRVSKLKPPVGGSVHDATVELTAER